MPLGVEEPSVCVCVYVSYRRHKHRTQRWWGYNCYEPVVGSMLMALINVAVGQQQFFSAG